VNPYFSDFASLPATITHGMWSSAATRHFVESVVAKGHPECHCVSPMPDLSELCLFPVLVSDEMLTS
jgi:acyl dehydratase